MTISVVAKTKFSIGGVTTGQELTDYEATGKTWTEVKEISDIGEFGDEREIIKFKTIGDGRVKKAVGTADAGDLPITCARVEDDTGQMAMRAASGDAKHYDFKIELTTGETVYMTGPISAAKNQLGGSDEVLQTVFTVAISSEVMEVAA